MLLDSPSVHIIVSFKMAAHALLIVWPTLLHIANTMDLSFYCKIEESVCKCFLNRTQEKSWHQTPNLRRLASFQAITATENTFFKICVGSTNLRSLDLTTSYYTKLQLHRKRSLT